MQLEDYTAEELRDLPPGKLRTLRRDAYRRHVDAMEVPDTLSRWATIMAKRYGPKVQIWENSVRWLEALMIARYGEAISNDGVPVWPEAFSQEDIDRAWAWAKGQRQGRQRGSVPDGVTYLDIDDVGLGGKTVMLLMAIGLWIAGHLAAVTIAAATAFSMILAIVTGHSLMAAPIFMLGTALTNFWENELIDHLFRGRSYTAPTDHYIALYTAAPGETGGGTEVSGGSYARVQVSAAFGSWEGTGGETTATDSAGTAGGTQNIAAVTFPAPTANWGVVSHMASHDASSAGNMYFYGALAASKTVNNGDAAPSFAAGAIDFALA